MFHNVWKLQLPFISVGKKQAIYFSALDTMEYRCRINVCSFSFLDWYSGYRVLNLQVVEIVIRGFDDCCFNWKKSHLVGWSTNPYDWCQFASLLGIHLLFHFFLNVFFHTWNLFVLQISGLAPVSSIVTLA